MLDNMNDGVRSLDCVGLVASSGASGRVLVEVSGGVTIETAPEVREGRSRPHIGRGPHPLGARARHRPRPLSTERRRRPEMLLAIDVGNTETVIGLFSLGPDDESAGAGHGPPSSEPPEPQA